MSKESQSLASRRDFAKLGLLSGFIGMTVYITDCGSSKGSGPSTSTPANAAGVISANHGHVATITAAQLSGGTDVTLDIQGTADHTHRVVVTAAQLVTIKGGGQVFATSTAGGTDSHTHTITFSGVTASPASPSPSGGGW